MIQQTEIAIAIENARCKLLRLISYWLFAANLLSAARHEILPRRVSALAATILYKLELATFLLINAYANYYFKTDSLHLRRITSFKIKPDSAFAHTKKLNLKVIIKRLEAIEKSLRDLPAAAKQLNESYAPRRASNFDAEASCRSKLWHIGAFKKARNFHTHINSQSRAPPSRDDFKTAPNKLIYQLTSCDGFIGGNTSARQISACNRRGVCQRQTSLSFDQRTQAHSHLRRSARAARADQRAVQFVHPGCQQPKALNLGLKL